MKRSVFYRRSLYFLLLATALGGGLVWLRSAPAERLRVGRISLPTSALAFVAEDLRYFEREGLEVDFSSFRLGRDAIEAMLRGEIDCTSAYQAPILTKGLQGAPLRILSTLHWSRHSTAVLARTDAGIRVPADLVGKRIGSVASTTSQFFLVQLLRSHGLPVDRKTWVVKESDELEPLFLQGKLSALSIWEPLLSNLRSALGPDASVTFHVDHYFDYSMLVTLQKTVTDRRSALLRYLRALRRAQDFVREYPEGALAVLEKHFKPDELQQVRQHWQDFHFELRMDNVLLADLEEQSLVLAQTSGRVGGDTTALDLFWPELLEQVAPESVTVVVPETGASP